MYGKYTVTRQFLNELSVWRDDYDLGTGTKALSGIALMNVPAIVREWWVLSTDAVEANRRLISIIQWLNGEDVFEVKKPHKFVVRSKKPDQVGDYQYLLTAGEHNDMVYFLNQATKFETRDEAESWANSHQDVIEVDEQGHEVDEFQPTHKFVVRDTVTDDQGDYQYVHVGNGVTAVPFTWEYATRFDTREEAESWANSHQEVVEVNEYDE